MSSSASLRLEIGRNGKRDEGPSGLLSVKTDMLVLGLVGL